MRDDVTGYYVSSGRRRCCFVWLLTGNEEKAVMVQAPAPGHSRSRRGSPNPPQYISPNSPKAGTQVEDAWPVPGSVRPTPPLRSRNVVSSAGCQARRPLCRRAVWAMPGKKRCAISE